jgi:ABC-type dipeptide/oligopeptide/nickel transport system permease component
VPGRVWVGADCPGRCPSPLSEVADGGHSVPSFTLGSVAIMGFATMVGLFAVVGCSSLTVAGVESLQWWRQNERQGSGR